MGRELDRKILESLLIKVINFEKKILNENKNPNSTKYVGDLKKIIENEVTEDANKEY